MRYHGTIQIIWCYTARQLCWWPSWLPLEPVCPGRVGNGLQWWQCSGHSHRLTFPPPPSRLQCGKLIASQQPGLRQQLQFQSLCWIAIAGAGICPPEQQKLTETASKWWLKPVQPMVDVDWSHVTCQWRLTVDDLCFYYWVNNYNELSLLAARAKCCWWLTQVIIQIVSYDFNKLLGMPSPAEYEVRTTEVKSLKVVKIRCVKIDCINVGHSRFSHKSSN